MVLNSYKQHFKNPIGAFSFVYLCKYFPELSFISTDKDKHNLFINAFQSHCSNAKSLKDVFSFIKDYKEDLYFDREDGRYDKK